MVGIAWLPWTLCLLLAAEPADQRVVVIMAPNPLPDPVAHLPFADVRWRRSDSDLIFRRLIVLRPGTQAFEMRDHAQWTGQIHSLQVVTAAVDVPLDVVLHAPTWNSTFSGWAQPPALQLKSINQREPTTALGAWHEHTLLLLVFAGLALIFRLRGSGATHSMIVALLAVACFAASRQMYDHWANAVALEADGRRLPGVTYPLVAARNIQQILAAQPQPTWALMGAGQRPNGGLDMAPDKIERFVVRYTLAELPFDPSPKVRHLVTTVPLPREKFPSDPLYHDRGFWLYPSSQSALQSLLSPERVAR